MRCTPLPFPIVLSAALTLGASSALADDVSYADIVSEQVQPAIDAELIPGGVVGIYKDGETSFYPVGTLNFDQDQVPTVETLYEIGSISKVITGVFFADAVRRGELARDTPVNELLPEGYSVPDKDEQSLLLWHLSTHTSGWGTAPANIAPKDGERPFTGYTQKMMFDAIEMMPLKQAPGTKFEYSNYAVGMLGTLVSLNAEGEYEALVKERVLNPLGLDDFTITLSDEQLDRLAPATTGGRATKHWGKTGPIDPAGMWVTDAPGLLGFAIASLGEHDGEVYESIKLSQAPLFDLEMGRRVCSGWFRASDQSTYWHNGMTGGYSSYMAVNPAFDAAVVLLTNGAAEETTIIGEKIIQGVFGLNPAPIKIEKSEKLDEEFTARLVGTYHSVLGFDMFITAARGKVFVQITGQQPLELVFLSGNRFRIKLVDAELEFDAAENAVAASVTLFQNGREIKCERVDD